MYFTPAEGNGSAEEVEVRTEQKEKKGDDDGRCGGKGREKDRETGERRERRRKMNKRDEKHNPINNTSLDTSLTNRWSHAALSG